VKAHALLVIYFTLLQEKAAALGLPSHLDAKGDLLDDFAAHEQQFGCPYGNEDQWGSCIRLARATTSGLETLSVLHLDNNEAALCMCLVSFDTLSGQQMLAVGTAKDLKFYPRSATGVCSQLPSSCRIANRKLRMQMLQLYKVASPAALTNLACWEFIAH
jgi:hypothetical protein